MDPHFTDRKTFSPEAILPEISDDCGKNRPFAYGEKFYDAVSKLCQPDSYNLYLDQNLSAAFYAINSKRDFEDYYGDKLFYLVCPQYAFLMQMLEVTDYSTYDIKWLEDEIPSSCQHDVLQNRTVLNESPFSSFPKVSEPFSIGVDTNRIRSCNNYWCRAWLLHLGMKAEKHKFSMPQQSPKLSQEAETAILKLAPFDKIILFAPDALITTEFPSDFWDIIANHVHKQGYTIIVYSKKHKIIHGISTFDLNLSLAEVVALGLSCANVFTLRSDFSDVLVGAREKLYVFYPAILHREMNGLNNCFEPIPNANEIAIWHWSIDKVVWEDEGLTSALQKYIDHIRRKYWLEKMLYAASWFSGKLRQVHQVKYCYFQNFAGTSDVFPENNNESPCLKFAWNQRITLLGLPVYTRKYDGDPVSRTVSHYWLGGLVRFRRSRGAYKITLLGIPLFAHNMQSNRVLFFKFTRRDFRKKWLSRLQARIDPKYDDIYILRHNIGESYVELMHFVNVIKSNQSQCPLLIVPDPKYMCFYRMFVNNVADLQLLPLHQSDIHLVFKQDTCISSGHQRFFCSTPQIAEKMKELSVTKPEVNFYDYIRDQIGIRRDAPPNLPVPSNNAINRVAQVIQRLKLGKRFVILAPESTSMQKLCRAFWEKLAVGLNDKGYALFLNAYDIKTRVKGAEATELSIEELYVLAQGACGIVSMASGLGLFLSTAGVQTDLIYTHFNNKNIAYNAGEGIRRYSALHLPNVHPELIKEYNTDNLKEQELLDIILQRY